MSAWMQFNDCVSPIAILLRRSTITTQVVGPPVWESEEWSELPNAVVNNIVYLETLGLSDFISKILHFKTIK